MTHVQRLMQPARFENEDMATYRNRRREARDYANYRMRGYWRVAPLQSMGLFSALRTLFK